VATACNFKIGDSVVVKPEVKDPDLGIDIEGWQGRIVEIEKKDSSVGIAWDSMTLKSMPDWIIVKCETDGLDWRRMYLHSNEVELATPGDTEVVPDGVDPDEVWPAHKRWEKHLRKVLQFPFDAEISGAHPRGPLQPGDRVRVHDISLLDDSHGVIVKIRLGHRRYDHPLDRLKPLDKNDPNFQIIKDYATWFANR